MEEKVIAKGILKSAKSFCVRLPIFGLLITWLYDYLVASQNLSRYGLDAFEYAFGSSNGANFVLYMMVIVLAIVGVVFYKRWSKVQITVTNKRVYGYDATAKRVDLPLDSITAVATGPFNGLAVTTASGAIKFVMLKNRDELHEEISKLLVGRQEKPATIKQENSQGVADELKKFKELLDMGVITQEEFDAKKKELLGL